MKLLTDRKEIAYEINIKRTPVITIDIAHERVGYKDCYEGSKIQVATPSRRYPEMTCRCIAAMFGDDPKNKDFHDAPWMYGKIQLTSTGACIKSSFGYSDVMEMVEWSNTRIVNGGDEVIVIFDKGDSAVIRKMRVSEKPSFLHYTVAVLEDVE